MLKFFTFFFTLFVLQTSLKAQYTDTIRVIDEDGFPVINASVFIVDKIDNVYEIDSASQQLTDIDGKAIFRDIGYDNRVHIASIQHRETTLSIHDIRANNLEVVLESGYLTMIQVIGKGTTNEKIPLSEIPNKVTVIDRKDIELYNPQTSADALAQSGDVFVQKSQMGGGSPIIRGFEANKVLLVIDGVRMNNAIYRSGHLQNAITIDNAAIERVEVHHGPGSVMYGSDALGGVMHFYTKTPRLRSKDLKPMDANVYTRFSTANYEATVHADVNVGSEKIASYTSVTYSAFQDLRAGRLKSSPNMTLNWNRYFYATRNDSADIVEVNENPNVQVGTRYSQLDAIQKIRFKPKQGLEFLFNLQYSTSSNIPRYDQLTEGDVTIANGQITEQTFKYSEWFYGPQQRLFGALTAKIDNDNIALFSQANITAAYQKIDEDRITRKFDDPLRRIQQEDVHVLTLNADFIKKIGKKNKPKSKLLYGVEATHNIVQSRIKTQNILTGELSNRGIGTRYPDGGSFMTTAGLYASYKLKLGEKANVIGGVRYVFSYTSANFLDTVLYSLPYSTIVASNHAVTGSLALAWDMGKQFQFNTAFSSSFRTPNIDDNGKIRAKGDNITIPNPSIKPEQALNFEATLGKQFKQKAWLGATFFYTHIFDAILQEPYSLNGVDSMYYDGSFRSIYSNINAGQATIWGLSANLKVEFTENIFMKMGVNYTEGRELETGIEPQPLAHIPPLYGQFELGYKRKIFQTRFNIRFNGAKELKDYSNDSSENLDKALPEGTPAWFTVNIYASFRLHKFFSINLGLENLLDWHYRPYGSGVSAPGMNVIVTLRGHF
ncbi:MULTISPECIES: TonB-dependent siderophore receptor [unclassified Aureispira]|uniref:TonB-dependent receptor plug domain-containing protein n=1 Tax=unclassified Aureispira TaxID=2649989 RepID=UPI000695E0CB|nr:MULTISPECIES: TonB-dependent receptor [unclassified Aureispira]WMX16473.1 TonB-dependent receptor [Aureispira sp. CCB-E]